MKRLLRKFIEWVMRNEQPRFLGEVAVSSQSQNTPTLRIGLMKAMNGRILEISTYKPNPHGSDWITEMFIVPEDQTIGQSVTMVLSLKGLNT